MSCCPRSSRRRSVARSSRARARAGAPRPTTAGTSRVRRGPERAGSSSPSAVAARHERGRRAAAGPEPLFGAAATVAAGLSTASEADAAGGVWLQLVRTLTRRFGVAVIVADMTVPGLRLVHVNPAFTKLTGYEPDDALGRNCRFLQRDGTTEMYMCEEISAHLRTAARHV